MLESIAPSPNTLDSGAESVHSPAIDPDVFPTYSGSRGFAVGPTLLQWISDCADRPSHRIIPLTPVEGSSTVKSMGNTNNTKTIDLGNNESLSRGVFYNEDGTFTAMSFSQSKTFKSYRAAFAWLERKTAQ